MIKYHKDAYGNKVAEILPGPDLITGPDDILDLMVSAGYQDCNKLIIHKKNLHQDFFDLRTGLAGEILQKFSNYRMKLAIVGDFSGIKSRSFHDFVRESNKRGIISFVDSLEKALI
jgi:Domain of unknown function (DUF4180)